MSQASPISPGWATAIGLAAAFVLFALTFRGPRPQFWQRMTVTGLALGGFALFAQSALRQTRLGWTDLLGGLGSAAVLYLVFQIGDRVARRLLSRSGGEIDQIYGLERLRPKWELAARLGLIIAPSEELFWRGLIQSILMAQFGIVPGLALGVAAYAGAHLVTGNLTLIGAAAVAGAFWGAMFALGAPIGMLIVSHVAWDIFIFLIAPTIRKSES